MVHITLTNAGKRFNKEWIFKALHVHFQQGMHYALIGNNGSGKSTLLQIIAGYISLSKGTIDWGTIDAVSIFKNISIAAPYLELIEEFTTLEQIEFHKKFKPFKGQISNKQLIEIIGLPAAAHKQIRNFSSGMKQRLKLGLAIFSDTPILLLDEPCSNLDKEGYALYQSLIEKYASDKLIIVGSNDPKEYTFCNQLINLADYKELF